MYGKDKAIKMLGQLRKTKTSLRKRLWQGWYNPTGRSIPVFLVGNGRSGTNMLARQLGKSWQVELYNEDHPTAFQDWRLKDLTIIEELVICSRAPVTLFKAQQDTHLTRVLLSHFPTAKSLFIFRHYHDVVNSARKKFWNDHNPSGPKKIGESITVVESWIKSDFAALGDVPLPEETKNFIKSRWNPNLGIESAIALHWLFRNRLFFDMNLYQEPRIKSVQYESVVLDPTREFQDICRFLELQFEFKMADGIFSSSIKRGPPPPIDLRIEADCKELWQRLCQHTGKECGLD